MQPALRRRGKGSGRDRTGCTAGLSADATGLLAQLARLEPAVVAVAKALVLLARLALSRVRVRALLDSVCINHVRLSD